MTVRFATREQWLVAAVKRLAPLFKEQGVTLPPVKVSVGWPGGRGKKNTTIGQCWSPATAKDEVSHIFISPTQDDAVRILDVLAHELVHAVNFAAGDLCGHKGAFKTIAESIGLTGKMTATVASDELRERLVKVAEGLGDFPHGALSSMDGGADSPKKQGTRMILVQCADGSGYKVRMTRKWLEEVGAPLCPCHNLQMQEG